MPNLSIEQRREILAAVNDQLLAGELTLGQAVYKIRSELYGMSQGQYAKFIGLSEKTLRDIEKGNTDSKLSVLSKVFAPAGMRITAQRKPG
jgi:DNA-binding XRE family transcriptional regulator